MSNAPVALSVVVPVLNEAAGIVDMLNSLTPLRQRGAQIIVVDGGSSDSTCALAQPYADLLLQAARGRAAQMNAGAAVARGDVLLFLHADTRLPGDADRWVAAAVRGRTRAWGRFDVVIDGCHPLLRLVAQAMNVRSRVTGVATGDQAIFVARHTFTQVSGFPLIGLMEDVALSKRLRQLSPPARISEPVITSARRWKKHGVCRTIGLMWGMRLAYVCGVAPATLARWYGSPERDSVMSSKKSSSDDLPR